MPSAIIGGLLAASGVIVAAFKGFHGAALPILGGVICGGAVAVFLSSTTAASYAIQKGLEGLTEKEEEDATKTDRDAAKAELDAIKADYIAEHLELYDISAEYRDILFSGRVASARFKLRNKGERTLVRVRVVVYFEDAKGGFIAEEDFLPVDVSNSSDDKPLKPGYIREMEKQIFSAKSIPSEWKEGAVSAKVTDIKFSTEVTSLAIRKGLEQEDAAKAELDAIKADYIAEHLELYDISAKYTVSLLSGRVASARFKLRNKGERTLATVRVVVYFEDAKGGFIAEEDFLPVGVSSSSGDKPLKPGYIREMEKRVYSAKSVPSEWKEGAVSAKVTDIEFSE